MASKDLNVDLRAPQDDDVKRDRVSRVFVALILLGALMLAPMLLFGYWGALAGDLELLGASFGVLVGAGLWNKALPYLLVSNPDYIGMVTIDPFSGDRTAYGPGLHFSYLWEERSKGRNYSLQLMDSALEVPINTERGRATLHGLHTFALSLPYLTITASHKPGKIDRDMNERIKAELAEWGASLAAATNITAELPKLNERLADRFVGSAGKVMPFEKTYGVRSVSVVISRIEFPDDVQTTRDAVDEAKVLFQIVASMLGITPEALTSKLEKKEITNADYKDLLNRAMAISKNATSMQLHIIEGNPKNVLLNGGASDETKRRRHK